MVLQHLWHPASHEEARHEAEYQLGPSATEYEINELARRMSAEAHERYMSGEDAVTLCNKCAYLEDIHGMVLCSRCNTHYKHVFDRACKWCLSAEKYGPDLFEGVT